MELPEIKFGHLDLCGANFDNMKFSEVKFYFDNVDLNGIKFGYIVQH